MIDRTCVAYITNEDGTRHGSGLVIATEGSSTIHVLTCWHVIKDIERIHLHLVCHCTGQPEDYREVKIAVPRSQTVFSSAEADVAMLVADAGDAGIHAVPLRFGPMTDGARLKALGYPLARDAVHSLVSSQDELDLLPAASAGSDIMLSARIADAHFAEMDLRGALRGFSGSPVYYKDEEGGTIVCGLLSGLREGGRLGRVELSRIAIATKMLRESFGVSVEYALDAETGEWSSQSRESLLVDGAVDYRSAFEVDSWLSCAIAEASGYGNGLKMGQAIQVIKSAIEDDRFSQCSTDLKVKACRLLSFFYRISGMHNEAEEALDILERRNLSQAPTLVDRAFNELERGDVDNARLYAQEAVNKDPLNKVAKLYVCECDILSSEEPDVTALSEFIDGRDNLRFEMESPEDESLMYQQLGWILGAIFGDRLRAMRCLRRSFAVDGNLIVCETLACVERDYALRNALTESSAVVGPRIDRGYLGKSREHFLQVLAAADDVYLNGFLRRAAMAAMSTFFLSEDVHQVMSLYRKLEGLPESKGLDGWRDIQMMVALTEARHGEVDPSSYPSLDGGQRLLVQADAAFWKASRLLDLHAEGLRPDDAETVVRDALAATEEASSELPEYGVVESIVRRMNLLLRGSEAFGWDEIDSLHELLGALKSHPYADRSVITAMETVVLELEDSDTAERRYRQEFEQEQTLQSWVELRNFLHRRRGRGAVDSCYRDLFENHRDLCDEEPEMIARAYLEFNLANDGDLASAMTVLSELGGSFADVNVLAFYVSDISLRSMSFNDPDGIEGTYHQLMDEGLVSHEEYRKASFDAYLANLELEKAKEFLPDGPLDPLHNADVLHYMACNGRFLSLGPLVDFSGMNAWSAKWLWERQSSGDLFDNSRRVAERHGLDVSREVVVDAWGIYQLYENEALDILYRLDTCWITHSSVVRLMNELAYRRFESVSIVLEFIRRSKVVQIASPSFAYQLKVRRRIPYYEPMSAIAMALERRCPAVLGVDDVDELIAAFREVIIRPCNLDAVLPKGLS